MQSWNKNIQFYPAYSIQGVKFKDDRTHLTKHVIPITCPLIRFENPSLTIVAIQRDSMFPINFERAQRTQSNLFWSTGDLLVQISLYRGVCVASPREQYTTASRPLADKRSANDIFQSRHTSKHRLNWFHHIVRHTSIFLSWIKRMKRKVEEQLFLCQSGLPDKPPIRMC